LRRHRVVAVPAPPNSLSAAWATPGRETGEPTAPGVDASYIGFSKSSNAPEVQLGPFHATAVPASNLHSGISHRIPDVKFEVVEMTPQPNGWMVRLRRTEDPVLGRVMLILVRDDETTKERLAGPPRPARESASNRTGAVSGHSPKINGPPNR
jgi:hypothetical protein